MKKIISTVIFAIVTIVILIVPPTLLWKMFCLNINQADENYTELLLQTIIGAIAYLGTVVLGVVAFWQTRNANYLSKLLSEKQLKTNVSSIENFELSKEIVQSRVIMQAKKYHLDGVYYSEQGKSILQKEKDISFLLFVLYFKINGANLSRIKIKKCSINKTFKDREHCYIPLIKLDENKNTFFTYDSESKCYRLDLYIHLNNFEKIQELNKMGIITLDINCKLINVFNQKTKYNCTFNIRKIKYLNNIISGKIKTTKIKGNEITFY